MLGTTAAQPAGRQSMNLHFTFSVREITEIRDNKQLLKIPMYLQIQWQVN